jgi:hypothetical protein
MYSISGVAQSQVSPPRLDDSVKDAYNTRIALAKSRHVSSPSSNDGAGRHGGVVPNHALEPSTEYVLVFTLDTFSQCTVTHGTSTGTV